MGTSFAVDAYKPNRQNQVEDIMSTVQSYIDQTQQQLNSASAIMTDEQQHEVRCGMCARELYVDDEGYRLYMEAINSGLDNPFRCEVCHEEYDDLAYEG